MAKPKKKPAAPAAKPAKKPSIAQRRKKRRTTITKVTKETREVRQNPAANPPLADDFTGVIVPGFGAFAGTRVLQRMVYQMVQKRWPKLGKHAHALSGAIAFGGVWLAAHRIRALAKYHDGIVVGSGLAALYGIAQCYLPQKYRWLIADCKPADVKALPGAGGNGKTLPSAPSPGEGGDEFSYLEAQLDELEGSGSRAARAIPAPRANSRPVASAMAMAAQNQNDDGAVFDPDLMEELGNEDVDSLYSGAFSTN